MSRRKSKGAFSALDFRPKKQSRRRRKEWWDTVGKKRRKRERGLLRYFGDGKQKKVKEPLVGLLGDVKKARKSRGMDGALGNALRDRLTPNERMEIDVEVERAMSNDGYLDWAKRSEALMAMNEHNLVHRLVNYVKTRLKFG